MSEPSTAVFLSYASEDAGAAQRISEALRAAGVEVWFDQSALVGGDAWDQKIRRQIRECALLIPIISSAAEARTEGYFRLEWRLADQRTHLMAKGRAFLLPVVIDGTRDADAHVPDSFTEVQWTRLPGGETTSAFVQHVQRLLEAGGLVSPGSATAPVGAAAPPRSPRRASLPFRIVRMVVVGTVLIVLITFIAAAFLERAERESAKPPAVPAKPVTGAGGSEAPAASATSVAVLPFDNLSDTKENEYFSDGISEELLTVLQKIPGLKVSARTSSFYFRGHSATAEEIGSKLGVNNLIEGSVRRAGHQVRITARLSRASTGEQLWSESYTRDVKDVFTVQSELAVAIVQALRGALTGAAPENSSQIASQVATAQLGSTSNAEAHEFYLQGKYFSNQPTLDNLRKAVGYFERAVKSDPSFALAWANIGRLSALNAEYATAPSDVIKQMFSRARTAAERSLKLQPELPEGFLALSEIQSSYEFDWRGSRESMERALALSPSDALVISNYSQVLMSYGDLAQAAQFGRRAVELDPVNAEVRYWLGVIHQSNGHLTEAENEFHRAAELSPSLLAIHRRIAVLRVFQGRPDDAIREAKLETLDWSRDTGLAIAYFAAKDIPASDAALARLIAGGSLSAGYQIAEVHAFRGDLTGAFAWLDKAIKARDSGLPSLRIDPLFANLRGDPRYPAILRKVGLSDEQLRR